MLSYLRFNSCTNVNLCGSGQGYKRIKATFSQTSFTKTMDRCFIVYEDSPWCLPQEGQSPGLLAWPVCGLTDAAIEQEVAWLAKRMCFTSSWWEELVHLRERGRKRKEKTFQQKIILFRLREFFSEEGTRSQANLNHLRCCEFPHGHQS